MDLHIQLKCPPFKIVFHWCNHYHKYFLRMQGGERGADAEGWVSSSLDCHFYLYILCKLMAKLGQSYGDIQPAFDPLVQGRWTHKTSHCKSSRNNFQHQYLRICLKCQSTCTAQGLIQGGGWGGQPPTINFITVSWFSIKTTSTFNLRNVIFQ